MGLPPSDGGCGPSSQKKQLHNGPVTLLSAGPTLTAASAPLQLQPRRGNLAVPLEGGIARAPAPGGSWAQGGFISGSTGGNTKGGVLLYNGQIFLDGKLPGRYAPRVALKPGIGRKAPEDGKWLITGWCSKDESHEPVLVRRECNRITCPEHYQNYIREKAEAIAERFKGYETAKCQENAVLVPGERRQVRPRHFPFTISPAHTAEIAARSMKDGYFNESAFLDAIRAEFNQALKISGLLGGVSVYHDGRLRHPETGGEGNAAKLLIGREAKQVGNMKPDDPKWKVYDHIRKQKNWREYWRFGPHFHVIAFGTAIDIKEFEEKMPGWTYHNKGVVKDVFGLALYLLSHTAVIPGRKSISWFGRLSQHVLKKQRTGEEFTVVVCPTCGAPLVIHDCVTLGIIGREMTRKTVHYTWFFRECGPPPA